MKTKSLVMTAAVALAGAVSCFAQPVYSVNVVGYVNLEIEAGYSMIANQLNASPNNTVTNIFKSAPADFVVYKFNPALGGYAAITSLGGGDWDPVEQSGLSLNPGEGCFVYSPSKFTNTFVGEISSTNSITMKNGYNIYSSPLPLAGAADTVLGIPIQIDDVIYRYNATLRAYYSDTFLGDGLWDGSSNGSAPSLAVGQSFWYYNPNPQKTWTKNYTP